MNIKCTYRENYLYTDTIMPGKKGGGKKGKRGGRKHINKPVHRGVNYSVVAAATFG